MLPMVRLQRVALHPEERKSWAVSPHVVRVDRVACSNQNQMIFLFRERFELRRACLLPMSVDVSLVDAAKEGIDIEKFLSESKEDSKGSEPENHNT